MIAIIKKELKNYFYSPIGYVIIGIFLIIFSVFFYATSMVSLNIDLTDLFYCVIRYGAIFIIPLLTMWSISGERKNGTDQLLMTSPTNMIGVILAKFLSALIFIIIPIVFSLMYFLILAHYNLPDIPTYLLSILGFLLLSMAYMSMGILTSSITKSPLISAILSFTIIFCDTYLPYIASSDTIYQHTLLYKFTNFLEGKLDITALIFLVTFTIMCLTISIIIMQKRKSFK